MTVFKQPIPLIHPHYLIELSRMNGTLKLIEISPENYILFDGKEMQIFPLDYKEHLPVINYLKEKESSGKTDPDMEMWIDENIKPTHKQCIVNNENSLSPKLSTLILPITAQCNLACPYCFAQTSKGNFNFRSFSNEDIDELLSILYKKIGSDPVVLVFFGGEPLIKFDVIRHTVDTVNTKYKDKMKVSYSVTTNGTLLTKDIINFLKENHFAVLLSIDGPDNEFNLRHFKNGKPSIHRVLERIKMMKEAKMDFEIRATITSNNPYIVETYKFLEALEVKFTAAFAYSSENKSHKELTDYNSESLKNINKSLSILLDYYRIKIEKKEPIYNSVLLETLEMIECRVKREKICAAGLAYHTILYNGDMYSCAHLMNDSKYKIGNIKNFEEGILKPHFTLPTKLNEIKGCEDCWVKNLCVGGCPSQKILTGRNSNQCHNQKDCDLAKLLNEFYIKIYFLYKKG